MILASSPHEVRGHGSPRYARDDEDGWPRTLTRVSFCDDWDDRHCEPPESVRYRTRPWIRRVDFSRPWRAEARPTRPWRTEVRPTRRPQPTASKSSLFMERSIATWQSRKSGVHGL